MHKLDTRIQRSWRKGVSGYISLICWDDAGWRAFAKDFGTAPKQGFRIMDALPGDPRKTTLYDLEKLVGLAATASGVTGTLLAVGLALSRFLHVGSSLSLPAACSIFGLAISAGIVIASLEGAAASCRTMILVSLAGAIGIVLSNYFPHANAVIYQLLSLTAGVAVGAVSIWSERRAGWGGISTFFAAGLVIVLAVILYWMTQKWLTDAGRIVAIVVSITVVASWALTNKNPHATVLEGIRVVSPIPILLGVIAIFTLPGDPDPTTWYYQLWIGLLIGTIIPVSDYIVSTAAGRSSILATPLIWAIVAHPRVAFEHLNSQAWPAMVLWGFSGSILGGLVAYLWRTLCFRLVRSHTDLD